MVAHGRREALLLGLMLPVMAPCLAWPARAAEVPPERFVADLAAAVIAALRDPTMSERARLVRVDELTAGAFDLERTARIALGRFWKTASDAERSEFAGQWIAIEIYSPATLPLRLISAIGGSPETCAAMSLSRRRTMLLTAPD